jgi:hypothetical protein
MSLNLIGILLIGVIVVMGYLRGIFRILIAFLSLLLSAILAKPFSFTTSWLINKIDFIPLALKPFATLLATGILLFLIFFFLGSVLVSMREGKREEEGLPRIPFWERVGGALLGGIWGLFLVVIIFTGLEIIGSFEEVSERISAGIKTNKEDDFLKKDWFDLGRERRSSKGSFGVLKENVQKSLFAPLVKEINPLDEKITKIFENLITVMSDPDLLQQLKNHPEISHLTENPKLIKVAEDEEIKKALDSSDIYALLNNPKIANLTKDKELIDELKKIDIEKILDEIVKERK